MSKEDNPLLVVEVRELDHKDTSRPMPIQHKVFEGGDSAARRAELAGEIDSVVGYFSQSFQSNPNISAVVKVTLKEEAIAKSHRPSTLFSRTSCPIIGALGYGELLVSADKQGLETLKDRIENEEKEKIRANISSIERIEPYTSEHRAEKISPDQFEQVVRQNKLKIRLFDHQDSRKNSAIIDELKGIISSEEIKAELLSYGDKKLYSVQCSYSGYKKLTKFIGLRSVSVMPSFHMSDVGLQTTAISDADLNDCPLPDPDVTYPLVGVIDSGVCPSSKLLAPWVVARETFVPVGHEDYTHGTMVAGLIVNSWALNHQDNQFPKTQAKIVDVNVFAKQSNISEEDLISIIEAVVPKYPEVKVWNMSLGGFNPVHETDFSDFAQFLDEMHDKYGCLFVVAAGNQRQVQYWPTATNQYKGMNRISSPGDSVRSLTVGSIAHKETPKTLAKKGGVSPFSRIGPGPCHVPKPELVHFGGNNSANGSYQQTGVLSIGPNDKIYESIGTSFSTPIVSSQAAAVWHYLDGKGFAVTPEVVKALLIHSAVMNGGVITADVLKTSGFGLPGDVVDALFCDENTVTLLFEVDVKHGMWEFERYPFPMPDCLLTDDGKFRGEIMMTLVYSPMTDHDYSSEYCRTNIDVGMGSYDIPKGKDKLSFKSKVPASPDDVSQLYEKSQIASGFKWSPVKVYHSIFPQGVSVETWRLKMSVKRRAEVDMPEFPQRASLVLSLRGLNVNDPVYNQAIRKMNQAGWIVNPIDQPVRITV